MKPKAYIVDCSVPNGDDGELRYDEMRIEPDDGLHSATVYMPDVVCSLDVNDLDTLIEVLAAVRARIATKSHA